VDLSTDPQVRFDCERCGRRIGFYEVMDNPDGFAVYEVERQPMPRQYIRPTGRHRVRYVDDRDGEPAWANNVAYSFECGCGHRRTIGRDALKARLVRASSAQLWL
jgi:hypothetical protein